MTLSDTLNLMVPKVEQIESSVSRQLPPKRTFLLDLDTFRSHLGQLAKQAGGNSALGRRLGITGQYVDFLIKGTRKPGKKLLQAIGARRKVMIEIDVEVE